MNQLAEHRTTAESEWRSLTTARLRVMVGNATCGLSAGSGQVLASLQKAMDEGELECELLEVGCIGLCYAEPLVCIMQPGKPGFCYGNVVPAKAVKLVQDVTGGMPPQKDCLGTIGPGSVEKFTRLDDTPVLKPQVRRTLERCGLIDPTNIHHYFANGGYQGLEQAFSLGPEGVIEEVKQAGLRGRGGAGFPTWRKWQFCSTTESDRKYLICNADEGDPGAFMNRSLIEGDPHALIEGMIIAAYALGAQSAYIYCRAEYPLALERLRLAIRQAGELGLLGENILGSGFNLDITIKEGAGAFVCGEETALIKSIAGDRGMPKPRPPFPAVSGLHGKPTIINNVETLAYVGLILRHGAGWYNEYGTEQSKGTKTIALVGKVNHTGLVEVPLGITIKDLVFGIGGGIVGGKKFKAVQTGGPSGGCLPASLMDIAVDYDSLVNAGTIMGSGGVVVMDEDTCMVDFARFFLDFAEKESCGECVPCRLGTRQLLTILTDITEGRGRPGDIEKLEQLAAGIKTGSLCGLGQTAPNPVLSTLRYFRDEYEAHIHEGRCPAKKCKAFITYHITDTCVGCGLCVKNCSSNAIVGKQKERHYIDQDLCHKCGACFKVCPPKVFSVEIHTGKPAAVKAEAEGVSV